MKRSVWRWALGLSVVGLILLGLLTVGGDAGCDEKGEMTWLQKKN